MVLEVEPDPVKAAEMVRLRGGQPAQAAVDVRDMEPPADIEGRRAELARVGDRLQPRFVQNLLPDDGSVAGQGLRRRVRLPYLDGAIAGVRDLAADRAPLLLVGGLNGPGVLLTPVFQLEAVSGDA